MMMATNQWYSSQAVQNWNDPSTGMQLPFYVKRVVPDGSEASAKLLRPWPVAVYFHSIGEKASAALAMGEWAKVAPEPYLLVLPSRPKNLWWFIDDESEFGWIQGNYSKPVTDLYCRWLAALAHFPGVDAKRIGLFGWSAGAYAVTEVLAVSRLRFSGAGLGAVHGHGQSDGEGLTAQLVDMAPAKFQAYLRRIGQHSGVPWMEVTHGITDQESKWSDAQVISATLNRRQVTLGKPEVCLRALEPEEQDVKPKAKKNKTHHNYFNAAFLRKEFFVALFGGPKPDHQAWLKRKKPSDCEDDWEQWELAQKAKKAKTAAAVAGKADEQSEKAAGAWGQDGGGWGFAPLMMMMGMMGGGAWGDDWSGDAWSGGQAGRGIVQNKGVASQNGKAGARPNVVATKTEKREKISDEQAFGTVVEWKGAYGWIEPDVAVDHPAANKRGGRIYVAQKDITGAVGSPLAKKVLDVGAIVVFELYADDSGLGAQNCQSL